MSGWIQRSLLVAAFAAAPVALEAQDTTTTQVQEARVLDHTFNAAVGEPVRVFLAKDIEYHVEIDGTGIQLQLRPRDLSVQLPRIEPLLNGVSATGSTDFRVTPHADAEYEFVSVGGDAGRPINLHVTAQPPKKKP